jgi:tRNA A-37 threonylcarbamoyl transferase component Bud32
MFRFRDTLSRTPTSLRTRFGSRRFLLRWGLPTLGVIVVLLVGLWTYRSVENAAKAALTSELSALRDAVTTSIRIWLHQQESFAVVLATQPHVQAAADVLLDLHKQGAAPEALRFAEAQHQLRAYMGRVLKERAYVRYRLLTLDGVVLSSNLDEIIGQAMPLAPQAELAERLRAGLSVVSRPFIDRVVEGDPARGGRLRDEAVMNVMAPLRGAEGRPLAVLSFQLRPDQEFSRILAATRTGQSTEAFAFDRQGVMLSQSRFDDALKQLGLIPEDGTSLLTLQMRDPGANLAGGARPAVGRFQQPLTTLVRSAIAGHTDINADSYLNYRGVPVVGAWTWLPDYGMGIGIEQDAGEAYASLIRLRWVFGIVFALLLLAGAGDIAASFLIAAQQKKLRQAVRESKRLGHYTLDEKLGEGGMGEVFRGSHALLRRQVAIKLLKPDLASSRALARFEREVQLTSRLAHPNTIAVYDFGRTPEGVFYYVMEYLEGITLERLVRTHGPLPEARAIHILVQICGSLEEAHSQGLIHRDIKPANVMLCHRHGHFDVVKVLDFGLVKDIGGDAEQGQTLSEGITGTPLYLAPEAIQDPQHSGAGRDIYAIGATGYFLLTGQTVFEGKNLLEICQMHVSATPVPPSQRLGRPLDSDLEAVILKCLAKKAEDRYASVAELGEALGRCAAARAWTRADAEAAWKAIEDQEVHGEAAKPAPPSTKMNIAATVDFTPAE